jgi:diaminopimelate decarboxylase
VGLLRSTQIKEAAKQLGQGLMGLHMHQPSVHFPCQRRACLQEVSDTRTQGISPFSLWRLSKAGPLRSAQIKEAAEQHGLGPTGLHMHPGGQ